MNKSLATFRIDDVVEITLDGEKQRATVVDPAPKPGRIYIQTIPPKPIRNQIPLEGAILEVAAADVKRVSK